MAQPKEMNRTSTSLEDKDAFLDLDNEKDFLASWKSITVGETDKFDFDLAPASKGKKKSFDFDQADMDFNLDGDFGTSFNIDIPDLDISPPLKKEVSNEKTKESSIRSIERKADCFTFAFDFDELGNFDLGSTVKTPISNIQIEKDNKEGFKCESSHEVEKGSVQNSRVKGIADIEDGTRKPFQLSNMMKFDMDSLVGRRSHLDKKDPFSAVATLDVSPGNEEVQVACGKFNISAEATMAAAELAPNSVGQTSMQEFTSSFPSTGAQVANPSKKKENEDFMTKNDAESGGKEDVVLPTTVGTCSKSALPENLVVIKTLEKEGKIEDCVAEKMEKQEHIDFSSLSEISSNIRLATGIFCEAPAPSGVDNQQTASHAAYMSQQTDVSNITLNKGRKSPISGSTAGAVVKSEKHKVHSMPFSTLQTFSLLSAKKAGVTQSTLPEAKRGLDGIQVDGKPVSLSLHSSNTLRGNESHTRTQNDLKMVGKICSVGRLSGEKETNNSSFKENDVLVKAKAKPCQREMIMKDLGILRNVKHASSPTTKSIAVEAERSSPVRDRKKIPILCGLRSSGLNTDPAKYQNQAALKSAGPFSKNGTLSKNLVLDTTHVPKSQMNASHSVGVKRKTVEDNQGAISTHPPKRCFQSPPAKRSPEEELEKIVNKKDAPLNSPEEDGIKNKRPDCYEPHFIHQDDKIRGLEMTYSVEDNININQAEVYGKQLDDLCNMLKKKQDEAKDTLVQAIVNNNKLLLLNSPLFEHKISAARKQMARLSLSSNHGGINHACV